MNTKIWIILTDDWELPGDGRGNVEIHQWLPAMRLMALYERLKIPATFCVDGLQAQAYERESVRNPELAVELKRWEQTVREMAERGFDVQAHAHAQWLDACWQDHGWQVGGNWNLACCSPALQTESLRYVRDRLQAIHPRIHPRAFRGGSWGIYCREHGSLIPQLADLGFQIDVSVAPGLHMDGDAIQIDYRGLPCPFLPWWPDLKDPRIPGREAGSLIMVPTQTFAVTDVSRLRWLSSRLEARIRNWVPSPVASRRARDRGRTVSEERAADPFGFSSGRARPDRMVLDFSGSLDLPAWRLAVDTMIQRALHVSDPLVPLILENHSKRLTPEAEVLMEGVVDHIRSRWKERIRFATLGELVAASNQIRPVFKGRSRSVRQACLQQVIAGRIADVARSMRGGGPDFKDPADMPDNMEAEHILQRLMLGLRRKLTADPENAALRERVRCSLLRIAGLAETDLRALDVWNHYWETDSELVDAARYLGLLLTWRERLS